MSCDALVLSVLLMVTNPPSNIAADTASEAICIAAAKHNIHPSWMIAYLAIENKDFHYKGTGTDIGLFQVNTHWHDAKLKGDVLDYYVQADAAATIINENIAEFGQTWQGIAAYNSWRQAKLKSKVARRYYLRWQHIMEKITPIWRSISQMDGENSNG